MKAISKKNYYGRKFKVFSREDFESNNRKCPKCGGDCDIDTNIPLYLRCPKNGTEEQKADGSLRCKKCGYIFIVDLAGIEDLNLDLKKEKYNNKEYYAITTKEWESIYKKCPICKDNFILHQKKDCENFYNCYFNEIQCKSGKDHIFMLIK